MQMNVWHSRWHWTFEQDDRAMTASSKRSRLREESAVHEGHREIRIGLSLNEHACVHQVIANSEPL
jgi:hypothetical protein